MKNFLLLILTSFFSLYANSGITITDVSGGSYVEKKADNSGFVIYGGLAGQCNSGTLGTCDTCNSGSVVACNQKNIAPTTTVSVTFSVSSTFTNGLTAYLYAGADISTAINNNSQLDTVTLQNGTAKYTLTTTWGQVCYYGGNFDSSCNPTGTASSTTTGTVNFPNAIKLFVYANFDGNNTTDAGQYSAVPIYINYIDRTVTAVNKQTFGTSCSYGMCSFGLDTPGDEKLYLTNFVRSASTPNKINSSDPDWYGLAFFYKQTTTVSNTITNSDTSKIIQYDSSYALPDNNNVITGLENYQKYCVLMGNVNKAQNIYLFDVGGSDAVSCGTPSEVVGMLDDKHCFISTAAFGSDMASEVQTFRKFRNVYLLDSSIGAAFVKWYYAYGPYGAQVISQSEILKATARVFLYPLYWFAELSLQHGFLMTLLGFILVLVLLVRTKKIFRFCSSLYKSRRDNSGVIVLVVSLALVSASRAFALDGFTPARTEQKPGATADGLVRIDKDGNYIYKQAPQKVSQASHLKIGYVSNPNISADICQYNNASNCQTVHYDDMYQDATGIGLEYLYESFFIKTKGKMGWQVGGSVQYASGHGRLASNPAVESVEKFSFLTVPLYGGLVYRFEYRDRQMFVPYVSGGGTYLLLAEKREDKNDAKAIGAPGFYGAGGMMLNLSSIDRDMGADFETEYDIQNLWLTAEFKFVSVSSETFSLENGFAQVGIGFDF